MNYLQRKGHRGPPSPTPTRHDEQLAAFLTLQKEREMCARAEGLPLTASWDDLEAHRLAQEAALSQRPVLFL